MSLTNETVEVSKTWVKIVGSGNAAAGTTLLKILVNTYCSTDANFIYRIETDNGTLFASQCLHAIGGSTTTNIFLALVNIATVTHLNIKIYSDTAGLTLSGTIDALDIGLK